MNTNNKVIIRSRDQTTTLPLTALDFSTFQTTWEKNSSYQVAFTAYDDSSLSFALLQVENSVLYDGQEYIIKQATDTYSGGVHSIQITATHIFYQLNNRRQNDVRKGDVSYSLQDALNFLMSVAPEYHYQVFGDINTHKTLTDFGNCTVTDGLSTISSNFGIYAIVPDNHTINLFSEANWVKKTGKAYYYRHDTSDVQLQYDSSNIVNRVQIVSTNDTPQFQPFYVTDDDSIKQWGIRDGERVENDQNNDTSGNVATAKRMLVTQPDLALTITTQAKNISKGEQWTLVIPESGITTKVQVVSITDTPFFLGSTQVSLNNTRQNFLDAFNARNREITELRGKMSSTSNGGGEANKANMWVIGKVSEV
ncbi:prophage endopeptidase tail family protein [Convivina intestini]|uniref:prophage endopeptidase tail family protein n=1 Tax=Convivina intestini TaxID=1505726 RepID=UPI0025B6BE62|nr:prophage endopeptidase tail family protein [Convivina intestini]